MALFRVGLFYKNYVDMRKNIEIKIEGTIDENTIEMVRRAIPVNPHPLHQVVVEIRSTDGSYDCAIQVYELLIDSQCSVTTRAYGYIASPATAIMQAASIGRREMSINGLSLIKLQDSDIHTMKSQARLYAKHSGQDKDTYIDLMAENNGNGKWLSAEECLRYGLIDWVI
jgi:ATP-dependent protease ClpP protease subunit